MSFKWDYATDTSRNTANADDRVVPFTAKYNYSGELFPVYAPYDASESREGIVWLTDNIGDSPKDSINGMTAVTPKGVADNALLKNSKDGQTVEGDVIFKGNITLNKPISGTAGSLTNARNITVQSGSVSGGAAAFDGSKDITITLPELDATTLRGIVPLSSIPQGAMERLIDVDADEDLKGLTKEKVQEGDWVRVKNGDTTYVVVDDSFLGTDQWEKAFQRMSFGKSSSTDGFTEAKKIELTGDVTGSDTKTGVDGWSIKTTIEKVDASAIKNGPIQIAQGGTGATTLKGAQQNLGITAIDGRVTELDGRVTELESADRTYADGTTYGDGFKVVVNGVKEGYAGSSNVGEKIAFHKAQNKNETASLSIGLPIGGVSYGFKCSTGDSQENYIMTATQSENDSTEWTLFPPTGQNGKIAVRSGLYAGLTSSVLGDKSSPFAEANIKNVSIKNGKVTTSAQSISSSTMKVYSSPSFVAQNTSTSKNVSLGIGGNGNDRGIKVSSGSSDSWVLYADSNDATHATVTDVTATHATVTDVTSTGSLSIDGANNETAVESFLSKLNIRMGASTSSVPSTGWNTTTGAPVDGCIFIKYE